MEDLDKKLYEDIGYIKRAVEKIDCVDKKLEDFSKKMDERMDKMDNKINWIYGWAAGVAGAVSLIFMFIKSKVWK